MTEYLKDPATGRVDSYRNFRREYGAHLKDMVNRGLMVPADLRELEAHIRDLEATLHTVAAKARAEYARIGRRPPGLYGETIKAQSDLLEAYREYFSLTAAVK